MTQIGHRIGVGGASCYTGLPNFCKTENCTYWSHYANRCTYTERSSLFDATRSHRDAGVSAGSGFTRRGRVRPVPH